MTAISLYCAVKPECMRTLFLLLFALTLMAVPLKSRAQSTHYSDEIMVMLKPGYTSGNFLEEINGKGFLGKFRVKEVLSDRYRLYLLGIDPVMGDSRNWLDDVLETESAFLAQLNYPVELRINPNDASFGQQWGLHNTGQSGGTADADIDAPEAWDITTGGVTANGDTIVVAVIDGGFQLNHPDLQANYFKNWGDIPGNGIDDDGNGYIDDRNGWNAYNNNGNVPSDQHGTHVAGIIGARGNNSTGVSGVNWNVKVMPIAGSSGSTSTVVAAYAYAARMRELYNTTNGAKGAFVVATNSSFGVDFGQVGNFPIWCAFYDTLGALGILSAGAGPNANTNIDAQGDIPTTCPSSYMIAVTNTTRNDTRNNSSGYGAVNMDLGAPGTTIYSTVTGSGYQNLTGTSMATPHVAGSIGLMYAAACSKFITDYKANPGALALQMRTWLLTGVDPVTALATNTSSGGRLNVHKALLNVQTYNCAAEPPPSASFAATGTTSGCAPLTVNFSNTSTGNGNSYSWVFTGGNPATSSQAAPTVTYNTAGVYNVQLTATNSGGTDTELLSGFITVFAVPAAPLVTVTGNTFSSSYATGNQWYSSGGAIGGATGQTFTPTQGGVYYVVHTSAEGCSSAASSTVTSTFGNEENKLFQSLKIYPNPAFSILNVDLGAVQTAGLTLIDAAGRVVWIRNGQSGVVIIPVEHLSSGVYTLLVSAKEGTASRKVQVIH